MSDFTQEFTRQVQNSLNNAGQNGHGVGRQGGRKIDKRWFVLGGLVLVLVILIVVLVVVSLVSDQTEETKEEAEIEAQTAIVGDWLCDDGMERDFANDGTYIWFGGEVSELGDYEERDDVLIVKRSAYYDGDGGRDSTIETLQYVLSYVSANEIMIQNGDVVHNCERVTK